MLRLQLTTRHKNYFFSGHHSGFTLIEILVAASILVILSGTVLVGFEKSKAKSRDSKRKADVSMITSAVLMYGEAHSQNYKFPDLGAGVGIGDANAGWGWFNCNSDFTASGQGACTTYGSTSIGQYLVQQGYLNSVPIDPTGNPANTEQTNQKRYAYMYYHYDSSEAVGTGGCKGLYSTHTVADSFYVYARLESPSADQSNAIDAAPDGYCDNHGYAKTLYNMNFAMGSTH